MGSPEATTVPRERRGRTIRRIVAFFGPYKSQVAIVLVAILFSSFIGLVNPILLKLLIDIAIPQRDWGLLNLFVGLMIVLPIISGLIGVGQSYLNNIIGQSVMQDLRTALYAHLQRMPLRFFTETKTGEIQSRLANDVGGVQSVVTDTAASLTSNIAIAVSTVVAMFIIDWRLTILSLGLLPFFMYLTYRVGKVNREVRGETQKSLAEMSAATEETLSVSGMLLSKTFGQQQTAIDRFSKLNRQLAKLQVRQAMVGRWFFMIIGTIFSITPAFVYWLAGYLAIQNDPTAPTIGDIVAFTTLQSRLFFPLGQLLNVQVEIQGALALFDRIFEYLELDPVIVDAPDAVDLAASPVAGRIRFRDVTFTYPTPPPRPEAEPAAEPSAVATAPAAPPPGPEPLPFGLRDIDFEVAPGQLVALVGPSGSGKTTTTYLVPRLYDVEAGAVEIDGKDVRTLSLVSLGRVIGFVTQETYLFHDTVRANILYAKPEATQAELESSRPGGSNPRPGDGPAAGLRHDRRRARLQALGRRKAADRDRARASEGSADPDPRRGDVGARHRQRATDPTSPGTARARPHDDRDRPPPLDHPARRPDPGLRGRPDRRAWDARNAARPGRAVLAPVPRAVRIRRR